MALLREAMEHPLDPGYALAAANGDADVTGTSRLVTLGLALVLGVVTVAAVARLTAPEPAAVRARALLVQEVERRTAAIDRQQKANQGLRSEITALQDSALRGGSGDALAAQLQRLELASGELPVEGEGVQITLDDAPGVNQTPIGDSPPDTTTDQGRVLDRDLQIVVNGLWAAGAESLSINGQRLTALSAIRAAGQAVLVDFRPLSPPYVVRAIGNPRTLQTGFADNLAGSYVQSLQQNYGISVKIAAEEHLQLPGAGLLVLRTARPVAPAPSRPPSVTPSPGSSHRAAPGGAVLTSEVF